MTSTNDLVTVDIEEAAVDTEETKQRVALYGGRRTRPYTKDEVSLIREFATQTAAFFNSSKNADSNVAALLDSLGKLKMTGITLSAANGELKVIATYDTEHDTPQQKPRAKKGSAK